MRSPVFRGGIRSDNLQQRFNQHRGSAQPRNLASQLLAVAVPVAPPSRDAVPERLQHRRLSVHANAEVVNHVPEMTSLSEPMVFNNPRARYNVKLVEPGHLPIPSGIHENKIRFAHDPSRAYPAINKNTRKAYDEFHEMAARCFMVSIVCFLS